jgi:actin-related protein
VTGCPQRVLWDRALLFETFAERLVVNNMKERVGYVALDFDAEMRKADQSVAYTLPRGNEVAIGQERFRCPELLFNPSSADSTPLTGHTSSLDDPGHARDPVRGDSEAPVYARAVFRLMGCNSSSRPNREVIDMAFIDIPLISNPNPRVESDVTPGFLPLDQRRDYGPSSSLSPVQTRMIDHTNLSVVTAPEMEPSRQQKFSEHFSHIDANTFQTLPLLSMPHIQMAPGDPQACHQIDDYCRFIEQVLTTLVVPLEALQIPDRRPLAVVMA